MFEPALDGSELEKLRGRLASSLPPIDLAAHADALVRVRAAVRSGDAADGARRRPRAASPCALAECCIAGGIGARVAARRRRRAAERALRRGPGGVVVAGPRAAIEALDGAIVLGEVGGDALEIDGVLSVPRRASCGRRYEDAIPAALAGA